MEHVAIDLGGRESQVCIRSSEGEILAERKVQTQRIGRFLERRPHSRVILETCSEAFRVADGALKHGHEVRVVPSTLVRALGVGLRGIKTDLRDARALSESSCRMELPSVHIRSEWSRNLKSLLSMRNRMVDARTQLINCVRGWMRTQLVRIRSGVTDTFPARVREKLLDSEEGIPIFVDRLLYAIAELNVQLKDADKEIGRLADETEVCRRLMTVPGVGPQTACHFAAAVDNIGRFQSAHELESYLGLTPGERSSSLRQSRTGITKAGPAHVRRVMVQACWSIWQRRGRDPLANWGALVAQRRGKRVAVVAMCRKLVGILYAIWRDGTTYDPSKVTRMPLN